ncbi:hypothetical protein PVK06_020957 [Gossypium arboreum]|uniref:Uncharacterized protein n=1 Tax=Gossypium arboreum TaxID=29729 RepID=A0ABR0PNN9_GOSAR|nr:hypothetical protein PVK06_020957 [Gossypium arboreum]
MPIVSNQSVVEVSAVAEEKSVRESVAYRPWMVVESKSGQNPKDTHSPSGNKKDKAIYLDSGGKIGPKQKRKFLWEGLKVTIPIGDVVWLAIGDFNFILSVSENKGRQINGMSGEWIYNAEALQLEAISFFQKLYSEQPEPISDLVLFQLLIEHGDIQFLGKEVSNDEIKIALFDMSPLKAPGSDGF